ncbi:MAG: hypothetical protein GX776_00135 [Oxalobacter sp.]|nr:hypothetical protein [Oxalobacter sp.]
MNADFYKSPWFLTLAGITLWACGYMTADDNRIERETRAGISIRTAQPVTLSASADRTHCPGLHP